MKWIINRNHNKALLESNTGMRLAYDYIKPAQKTVANYLQKKAERLSKTKKCIYLFLFSLFFGGCSITIMFYSFLHITTPVSAQKFTLPKNAILQPVKPRIKDSLITRNEYERIHQFKHYLEHLQMDASGKRVYDSLMQARPHLLDSIHIVDSIFQTQ